MTREIDLGPLRHTISKVSKKDIEYVVYKLSYAGKFIFIKGKTLVGSLILLADTLNSFNKDNKKRFKAHLYTHLYNHILENPGGRFRIKIIAHVDNKNTSFYQLLQQEQIHLDIYRYDSRCLNNQIEAYIPLYNSETNMYGWIPQPYVNNYRRWLVSEARNNLSLK